MGLVQISGGASPVTVGEMTTHLRLDGLTVQTDLLTALIAAATDFVQTETRRQLVSAVWQLTFDSFPSLANATNLNFYPLSLSLLATPPALNCIKLPLPPLRSVASVQYVDANGSTQTLSGGSYTVDTASQPGRIVLNQGVTWPATKSQANAVTVNFTAGYADASAVPDLLKLAIKLLAAHWYENREAVSEQTMTDLPMALQSIIGQQMFMEAQ